MKAEMSQEENIAPTSLSLIASLYKVLSETLYVNKTIPEIKKRHLQKYLELSL